MTPSCAQSLTDFTVYNFSSITGWDCHSVTETNLTKLFSLLIWVSEFVGWSRTLGFQWQEWAGISCVWLWRWGCCWLVDTQKCVPGVGPYLINLLPEAKSCLRLTDFQKWVHWGKFFSFFTGIFFLSAWFITSWCGSQSNCSLVVRNYWKPVFRKPFTKSILRIYKTFGGGVKCVMLFCCFCYNIVTTKFRV